MEFNVDEDVNRTRSGSPKRLQKPLNLSNLIKDGNITYDMDSNKFDQDGDFDREDPEECFKDKIWEHVNMDVLDNGDDESDPGLSPFERMKKKMTKVTEDGKIMKMIKKLGNGDVCPPNSHVKIHYQGYVEYKEVPFDVSYLRSKKPESYKLGEGGLIRGLELSIQTMKAGEKAAFLIHHEYAYGKMGCGQRIPAEATVMFEVSLVSFSENPDILSTDAEVKLNLDTVILRAEAHLKKGNERLTQDKDVELAIKHYKEAKNLILDFNLDKDNDNVLAKLLNRCYQNLAISYNQTKEYKLTCQMADDAMYIIKSLADNNYKLKFAWGKALSELNEFEEALAKFKEVKKMQPASKELTKELQKLDEAWKKYRHSTKAAAQKFFKTSNNSEEKKEPQVLDSFTKSMTEQLQQLKLNDQIKFLNLNAGMTADERSIVKNIASDLGLHYAENNPFGKETIVISK